MKGCAPQARSSWIPLTSPTEKRLLRRGGDRRAEGASKNFVNRRCYLDKWVSELDAHINNTCYFIEHMLQAFWSGDLEHLFLPDHEVPD